jgi:restriction system protein
MPTLGARSLRRRRNIRGWVLIVGLTLLLASWAGYRLWVQPTWISRLAPVIAEFITLVEMAAVLTMAALWIALWWYRGRRPRSPALLVDLEQLRALSPKEFEEFVAILFRNKGYRVMMRGRSGDRGVDLELMKPDGKRAIVQCKRYRRKIGPEIARELYGTLLHEKAAHAFLVTTAGISDATRTWARGKSMTLIDGPTLQGIIAVLDDEVTNWTRYDLPEKHTDESPSIMPPTPPSKIN